MASVRGKVVIVTGGSSGLGEATAVQFGKSGAKVVVAARREDKGQAVASGIQKDGGEAIFVKTDVTKRGDIENMVETTLATYGRLDCAVNNAGILNSTLTPVADITEEDWDAIIGTNLKGVFMSMKSQIPAMLRGGGGAIVNMSSIYGIKPCPIGAAGYTAAKHAVVGLSKNAAVDYGQQGIRVNVVSPGFCHSEIVDPFLEEAPELMDDLIRRNSGMNRVGLGEEVGEVIAWLCSDDARFVNGVVIPIDGGEAARMY